MAGSCRRASSFAPFTGNVAPCMMGQDGDDTHVSLITQTIRNLRTLSIDDINGFLAEPVSKILSPCVMGLLEPARDGQSLDRKRRRPLDTISAVRTGALERTHKNWMSTVNFGLRNCRSFKGLFIVIHSAIHGLEARSPRRMTSSTISYFTGSFTVGIPRP